MIFTSCQNMSTTCIPKTQNLEIIDLISIKRNQIPNTNPLLIPLLEKSGKNR